MATPEYQSESEVKRKRRHHHKSRNGCLECRRRRIKCDETKPTCSRCILGLHKCVYALAPQSSDRCLGSGPLSAGAASRTKDALSLSSPSTQDNSPEGYQLFTQTYNARDYNLPTVFDVCQSSSICNTSRRDIHEKIPYRHQNPFSLLSIPTLGSKSEVVLHSLLAISAASLAWTLTSSKDEPDIDAVQKALMLGYTHYNRASARMRTSLLEPEELEDVIASAIILVPFAASSQKINHWLSKKSGNRTSFKFLSSTPRDIIVMMRGIRTMLESVASNNRDKHNQQSDVSSYELNSPSVPPYANAMRVTSGSRLHALRTMIVATSPSAFSKLEGRVNSVVEDALSLDNESVLACSEAFDFLDQMRKCIFHQTRESLSPRLNDDNTTIPTTCIPWLRSFMGRSFTTKFTVLTPTEPLTRLLLSFYAQVPQVYLDLVLPLLDERLEKPLSANDAQITTELTKIQGLALDIYAHWSVLMSLVEEESWWIGSLPEVTLIGMVNRYGTLFVDELWPAHDVESSGWWPGEMLNMLQETKGQ